MTSIDIEHPPSLLAYLRRTHRIGEREAIESETLSGGVSNKAVLVRRPTGESWVMKQALPKLRTKADWFSDPARIRREALALEWLPTLAPPGAITPLVFRDDSANILAMEAVPQPHENWKTMLLAGRVEPGHVEQFADILATIHRASLGRADLQTLFRDCSYFESLRLEPYYGYAAEQTPDAAAFLRDLIAEIRSSRWTLTHGDYSPKNILVREGRLILLDHEVCHWGDGAFDVGFALTHLLSKSHHVAGRRDAFADAARRFWRRYAAEFGDRETQERAVRHTLGCLLARVAGRSPLEYLSEDERARQRTAVVALMHDPPATVDILIDRFRKEIERCP